MKEQFSLIVHSVSPIYSRTGQCVGQTFEETVVETSEDNTVLMSQAKDLLLEGCIVEVRYEEIEKPA